MYKEHRPIDIAIAKDQLKRINAFITEPLVLIGGLAVNQYHPARDSQDIDLICSHQQSTLIVNALFKSDEWATTETNNDDYRPDFVITHKTDDYVVKFGPKLIERRAYEHVSWEDLQRGARPFRHQEPLERILVPEPAALCVMKLLSYMSRTTTKPAKGKQDLQDLTDLANNRDFSPDPFLHLLERWKAKDVLRDFFNRALSPEEREIYERSSLARLRSLVSPESTTRIHSPPPSNAVAPAVLSEIVNPPIAEPPPPSPAVQPISGPKATEHSQPLLLDDLWRIALVRKGRVKGATVLDLIRKNLGSRLQYPLTALQETFLSRALDGAASCAFDRKEHLVISGPTSSGKTTIADAFLLATMLRNVHRKCAIYIAPTRALAQAKYRDFCDLLEGSDLLEQLVLSTGEDTAKDWRLPKGQFGIAFLVYEKANILFSRPGRMLQRLGCIAVDEIHMLDDLDRGPTLDVTLAKALTERDNIESKEALRSHAETLRIIAISTEDQLDSSLLELLSIQGDIEDTSVIHPLSYHNAMRPVPVTHNLVLPPTTNSENFHVYKLCTFTSSSNRTLDEHEIERIDLELNQIEAKIRRQMADGRRNVQDELRNRVVDLVIDSLAKAPHGYRLLIFVPTKHDVEEIGARISNARRSQAGSNRLKPLLDVLTREEDQEFSTRATRYARKGVYLHHSDVARSVREQIEILCANPDTSEPPEAIVATETLAYGVNLAVTDVILTGTMFLTTDRKGSSHEEDLSISAYHNMCGRAGRLGKLLQHVPAQVHIVLPFDKEAITIVERFYTRIPPVRSRVFVADDYPKGPSGFASLLRDSGMQVTDQHVGRATEVTYPFARSVLDLLRHANFVGHGTGNQVVPVSAKRVGSGNNLLTLFERTLYGKQLLAKHGAREFEKFADSIESLLIDCATYPLELVSQPSEGVFVITERGEAIIDTGTEIATVRTLLEALSMLERAWDASECKEEQMPIELFIVALLIQEEVYRTCIHSTPECKRSGRHNAWPPEISNTNRGVVDNALWASLSRCGIREDAVKSVGSSLRTELERCEVAQVGGRYPGCAVDSVLRLFSCMVDWVYGASQVEARARVQKFGVSTQGGTYDGGRFSFVQLTEKLRYKTVFLAKLVSGGGLRGTSSSANQRLLFLLSERVRFGCLAEAVPLFWPRASNLSRSEVGGLLDRKWDPSTIMKHPNDALLPGEAGVAPEKMIRLQADLEHFTVEEFESLAMEMTLAEPDSRQKRSAQEYWSMLTGQTTPGYFRSGVNSYRNQNESASLFSVELARLLGWSDSEQGDGLDFSTVSDHKQRRKADMEDGDIRLLVRKAKPNKDIPTASWVLQRFKEASGRYEDDSRISVLGLSFFSGWDVAFGRERRAFSDTVDLVGEADLYIIVALPWAPDVTAIPESHIVRLRAVVNAGSTIAIYTPAAFGALFSLVTRGIVSDDCFVEIEGLKVEEGIYLVGVEQVSDYVEERAENIPAAIREKLLRHFEVL